MIKTFFTVAALVAATLLSAPAHASDMDFFSPMNGVDISLDPSCTDPDMKGYAMCLIASYPDVTDRDVDVILDMCHDHTTCPTDTAVEYYYSASTDHDVVLDLYQVSINKMTWDPGTPVKYILKADHQVKVLYTTHDSGATWSARLITMEG